MQPQRTTAQRVLGALAILFAMSVLAWFVYQAQVRANQRLRHSAAPAPAELPPGTEPVELPASLPSSKFAVVEPPGDFLRSSKSGAPTSELPGSLSSSKGMVLPDAGLFDASKPAVIIDDLPASLSSSKSLVIEEPEYLWSSKSGRPLSPEKNPVRPKPKQPPQQQVPDKD